MGRPLERWGSGSHLISSQQPYRDHGRAFPWRLSLREGDSWISLGLVSPASDLNTNEGGRKLFFRLFLPCGPSTRLGTFELIHPSAWGSADFCCVYLLYTAQGSHSSMRVLTPTWTLLSGKIIFPSDQEIPEDRWEEGVLGGGQLCAGCLFPDPGPQPSRCITGSTGL